MNNNAGASELLASIAPIAQSGILADVGRLLRSLDQIDGLVHTDSKFVEAFCRIVLNSDEEKVPDLLRESCRLSADISSLDILELVRLFVAITDSKLSVLDVCAEVVLSTLAVPTISSSVQGECHSLLGWMHLARGDSSAARYHLTRASSLISDDFPLLNLIRCKQGMGESEEAKEELAFLLETRPDTDQNPLYYLCDRSVDSSDKGLFLHFSSLDGVTKSTFQYSAKLNPCLLVELASTASPARSIKAIDLVLHTFPRHESALLLLADLKPKEAESILEPLIGTSARACVKLATIFEKTDDFPRALQMIERAATIDPTVLEKGQYWWLQAKAALVPLRAIPYLKEGLSRISLDDVFYWNITSLLAHFFMATDQSRSALSLLENAKSNFELARVERAKILVLLDRLDEALCEIEGCSEPCVASLNVKLEILKLQGQFGLYVKTLAESCRLVDWNFIAEKYLAIGEAGEAVNCYLQSSDVPLDRLAEAQMLKHNFSEAERLFRTIGDEESICSLIELLIWRGGFSECLDLFVTCGNVVLVERVVAQAVEVTGELSWYTKGIEILKTRSVQRDVCPNDRSEVKAVIGEWHMLLGERDEAFKSFDEGLRLNPRHDRSLLGIAKIFMTRGDREGAIEFASRVSVRLKSEADEVLRELRVEGGDEGFTTPMVLNEQAIGRRSEGLNALIQYRLGLTSTNESESLIAQAIEVSVSRREDSVSQLRTLVRSATSQKEKDFVLLRLVSVVVIQYGDSEMGKTILGEVSSNSNHSTEFRFLSSLLDAVCDTTGLSEILKLYIAFHRSKKKEKRDLKSMVSKITQLDALTLLELDVTESVLDRLSAIRVSRREFAKAIEVCELWIAVVKGNPIALERYGQSLLGGGRVDEAIPALLEAKTANSKKLLVEAYKQTNRKHDLIQLMLSNEVLMDTGLLKQQLLSLRIG